MNQKALYLALAIFFLLPKANAQTTPDWATGVAPILYNHCTGCHHNGGIAPFALITFMDALTNAANIKPDILSKRMPPWPPDPSYNRLSHERLLSQQEINTIVSWVDGNTPQGNLALAPPAPTYNNNGDIPGTPDFVGQIPTFTSPATIGHDVYQCFVIPNTQSVDRFITAFEAIPGNPSIVHHVLVFADTTGICRHLDSLSPGPGYLDFGGVGTDSAVLIGAWVPGSAPVIYPNPFGVLLPHNADIVLQIHYPGGTIGKSDSTQIHLFFSPVANNSTMRNLFIAPVLNHYSNINAPLFIPADSTRSFHEAYGPLPTDFSLLGIAPHMHLIGKNIKSYGITPALDTQKFIRINNWDFHWQGFYLFRNIQKVIAGTTIEADAYYDNTFNNINNPSMPPVDVSAGENTTDEMMLVFYVFTIYQQGDENVVIDSTPLVNVIPVTYYHGQQLLTPYPNPASNELIVKCYFDEADKAKIDLLDMNGKIAQHFAENISINNGYSTFTYHLDNLPNGEYILQLKTSMQKLSQKVIIQH